MRSVVAYASTHGSTEGIARRIADGLRAGGDTVDLWSLHSEQVPDRADRLVIGSAIHNGQWLPEAEHLADTLASPNSASSSAQSPSTPVWAFSVSSVGATSTFLSPRVAKYLRPRTPLPRAVAGLETAGLLRAHRAFGGSIARGDWPGFGRIVFRLMGGTYGDARDWDDVDRWTRQILADQRSADPPQDGH